MTRPRVTFTKRQRERSKQEKKEEKAKKRAQRKAERQDRLASVGEDPDIAGIIPGPQPVEELQESRG